MVILDTNILIEIFRQNGEVIRMCDNLGTANLAITSVTNFCWEAGIKKVFPRTLNSLKSSTCLRWTNLLTKSFHAYAKPMHSATDPAYPIWWLLPLPFIMPVNFIHSIQKTFVSSIIFDWYLNFTIINLHLCTLSLCLLCQALYPLRVLFVTSVMLTLLWRIYPLYSSSQASVCKLTAYFYKYTEKWYRAHKNQHSSINIQFKVIQFK